MTAYFYLFDVDHVVEEAVTSDQSRDSRVFPKSAELQPMSVLYFDFLFLYSFHMVSK